MSNKNIFFLCIILVALAGFVGYKIYSPSLTRQDSLYLQKTNELKPESIQSIDIQQNSKTIELRKESNIWKINSKKADDTKVASLLTSLLPTLPPDQVAKTNTRHTEFELTDILAKKITLDKKMSFMTGKSELSGTYTRFDKDSSVYLLKNSPTVSINASDWYDKAITSFDPTKATKISIKDTTTEITLVKKNDIWVSEKDNKQAKKEIMVTVLSTASSLVAASVVEDFQAGLYPTSPSLTITIDHDGESETVELYKGNTDYLVKRLSDNELFIINEYSLQALLSAPSNLF